MNRRDDRVKQQTNNYARCSATGQIVFFNDGSAPAFTHPQLWVFYRRPKGADPETFRGRIVGENAVGEAQSDAEAPASAPS